MKVHAAIGLAAALGAAEMPNAGIAAESAAQSPPGAHFLARAAAPATGQVVRTEFLKSEEKKPRRADIVMLGKSADLAALAESHPLAVVSGLPQHGKTNLAQEAAFEYAVANVLGDYESQLLGRASKFSERERNTVLAAIQRLNEHTNLLGRFQGLNSEPTNQAGFFADKSLRHVLEVNSLLQKAPPPGGTADVETAVHISRNLHFADLPVQEHTVSTAAVELNAARGRYFPIKPFEGRSVILAANSERVTDFSIESRAPLYTKADSDRLAAQSGDVHRFGKAGLEAALRNETARSGGSLACFRAEKAADFERTKREILHAIANTRPSVNGFTFVFDGHGLPEYLVLCNGDLVQSLAKPPATNEKHRVGIYCEDLAEAFKERARRFPAAKDCPEEKRDIVILAACGSQDFALDVAARIGGLPGAPIFVCAAEARQLSHTLSLSRFGAEAFHYPYSALENCFKEESMLTQRTNLRFPAMTIGDLVIHGALKNARTTLFVPAYPKTNSAPRIRYMQLGSLPLNSDAG